VPVAVENDCNSATWAFLKRNCNPSRATWSAFSSAPALAAASSWTAKLYSGFSGTAGEIGHMVIQVGGPKCNCGNRGCFEALASRTAIFRAIHAAVKDGQKTLLTEMLGPDLTDLRSGDLAQSHPQRRQIGRENRRGSRRIHRHRRGQFINILNPQTVVLGGGVIDALGDEMMAIIVETAEDYILSGTNKGVEIVASKAGRRRRHHRRRRPGAQSNKIRRQWIALTGEGDHDPHHSKSPRRHRRRHQFRQVAGRRHRRTARSRRCRKPAANALGAGFYGTRQLQRPAIALTAEAVAEFSKTASDLGAAPPRVIATSAARDAINAAN
jgi:predicted NBD/HSP70 family sugar kinase